eukprot:TRINITY_DN13635_c0_g1_i2.p1 TRINITY_DN13635_c0_g1~~TRINITY_DN13635_c0_g1_i2.p1  ORF type:complete len:605 (+),score=62.85 TRINITY_DN13635_c0_g1_i2:408-2222(+)
MLGGRCSTRYCGPLVFPSTRTIFYHNNPSPSALLMLHPVQGVLVEYCEHLFFALLTEHRNRAAGNAFMKRRGMALRFIISIGLITVGHIYYEPPSWQPANPDLFVFGQDTVSGMLMMLLYCINEVFRKSFKTTLSKSVGSANVTVVSTVLSAPMLVPFIILYSGFAPHAWTVLQSIPHLLCLMANSVVLVVLPVVLAGKSSGNDARVKMSSRRQCAYAFTAAMLIHIVCVVQGRESIVYTVVLTAGCGVMMWSLTASQAMITRMSGSCSSDPFAEYELPEMEGLEGEDFLSTLMKSHSSRKLLVFLLLNLFYASVEFLYGVYSGSLGLVSDSFHMLIDSVSVGLALGAAFIATWPRDSNHPFGFGRYEVLSGFTNGVLLLCISLLIAFEAIGRIVDPPEIDGAWLLPVSIGGLLINIIGVVFFHEAHHIGVGKESSCSSHSHGGGHSHGHSHGNTGGSMNMRGVYLHVLADLVGSIGVIASSCIVQWTGWSKADPICSLCIAGLIFVSAFPLIKEAGKLLLQGVTPSQEESLAACLQEASQHPSVRSVTSHCFWQHTPGVAVGTVSIIAADAADPLTLLPAIRKIFTPIAKPSNLAVEITPSMS